MCGRFTLRVSGDVVADLFDLAEVPDLTPRYNIAPTQRIASIRSHPKSGELEVASLRWGLIPSWSDDPSIGARLLNARSDTVATKPAFRSAFRARRCVILADGFYEWQKRGKTKQPYFIRLQSNVPFTFAGLWEHWKKGDQEIESCTILTTSANELMQPLHDRMPVILSANARRRWLDPRPTEPAILEELLQPYSAAEMLAYPVYSLVNKYQNDDARCIEPLDSESSLF